MSGMQQTSKPAPDATTIILIRPRAGGAPELFMVRRSGGADFFGDAYVFPGGGVDAGDADPALLAHAAELPAHDLERLLGEGLTREQAIACWIAGVRELFEEAGVMLAVREDGAALDFADAAARERFAHYRDELRAHRISFRDLVERERLRIATDRIFYLSRIVTPPYARKRYDTRFVLAQAPADQIASHDREEVVSGEWLTAAEAIALYHSKAQQIVPPTLENLVEIEPCASFEAMVALARDKAIAPICPATVRNDRLYTLIYPGDRDFVHQLEPAFKSKYKEPAPMPILRFTLEKGGRWAIAAGVPAAKKEN